MWMVKKWLTFVDMLSFRPAAGKTRIWHGHGLRQRVDALGAVFQKISDQWGGSDVLPDVHRTFGHTPRDDQDWAPWASEGQGWIGGVWQKDGQGSIHLTSVGFSWTPRPICQTDEGFAGGFEVSHEEHAQHTSGRCVRNQSSKHESFASIQAPVRASLLLVWLFLHSTDGTGHWITAAECYQ